MLEEPGTSQNSMYVDLDLDPDPDLEGPNDQSESIRFPSVFVEADPRLMSCSLYSIAL